VCRAHGAVRAWSVCLPHNTGRDDWQASRKVDHVASSHGPRGAASACPREWMAPICTQIQDGRDRPRGGGGTTTGEGAAAPRWAQNSVRETTPTRAADAAHGTHAAPVPGQARTCPQN
jgi:hypothetical protein